MKNFKKNTIFSFIILFTNFVASQEISDNAIGLRIGTPKSFEVSFQRILGEVNRLEVDLGYFNKNNYDVFRIIGLNQWVVSLNDDNLNWFVGIGGGGGIWSYNNDEDMEFDRVKNGNFIAIAASVGLEYNFESPFIISLDFRPKHLFGNGFGNQLDAIDVAIGIRYQFD
jgi:hypothetical protein